MDHAQTIAEARRIIPDFPPSLPRLPTPAWSGPMLREETHASGTKIYGPATAEQRLYVVRSGRIRVLREGPGGRSSLADLLGQGAVFGHLPWGTPERAEESAVAGTDAVVWSADATNLASLCRAYPQFSQELMTGLGTSLQRDRTRIRSFASKEIPARLAGVLLRLGDELGERCTHGGVIDLRRISQEDVADLIGASRSFVSTLINEMKRWGWLGNSGRVLCLRDLKALRKAAFDDE